jgi:Mn2+/Fe2+ NRAMP family transporter
MAMQQFVIPLSGVIAIQLVSVQIGRVTGKGIVANVKHFAPRWLVISLMSLLVMANTFNIAADLAAMGEALPLVIGGLDREHALIFVAISVLLQVFVRYRRYAPVLKFLTLVLFLYVATAFTVHIPWGEAFARAVWPAAEINRDYLLTKRFLGTAHRNISFATMPEHLASGSRLVCERWGSGTGPRHSGRPGKMDMLNA